MEKKMLLSTVLIGSSLLFTGCGKESNSKKSSPLAQTLPVQTQHVPEKGFFKAVLKPMNENYAGKTKGVASFRLKKDEFYAQIEIKDAPTDMVHAQYVHAIGKCPGEGDDINKDGVIDSFEAQKMHGDYLISLDGELTNKTTDSPQFPMADHRGEYQYRDWASINVLIQDLRSRAISSGLAKLGKEEYLNLEARSVVIYGVPENTVLPNTVTGQKALLPIACGTIVKVSEDVGKY